MLSWVEGREKFDQGRPQVLRAVLRLYLMFFLPPVTKLLKYIQRIGSMKAGSSHLLGSHETRRKSIGSRLRRKSSVKGIIRRSCSIMVDSFDLPGKTQQNLV